MEWIILNFMVFAFQYWVEWIRMSTSMWKYNFNPVFDPEVLTPSRRNMDIYDYVGMVTYGHYVGRHGLTIMGGNLVDILSQRRLENYEEDYILCVV